MPLRTADHYARLLAAVKGQRAVLRACFRRAGVLPHTVISYETGLQTMHTKTFDAVMFEIQLLRDAAYGQRVRKERRLSVIRRMNAARLAKSKRRSSHD